MEVASGVIAVVSLSIQFADIVKEANAFLRGIKNAPHEVLGLLDSLTQLELMLLGQANALIEQQYTSDSLHHSIECMGYALKRCETSMRKLSAMVKKIQASFGRQHWVQRKWASLKAVLEKEDIERLRNDIHNDQASLQMALLINMSRLQYSQRVPPFPVKLTCYQVSSDKRRQGQS